MACSYLKRLCRGSCLTVHNDFNNLVKKYRVLVRKVKSWRNTRKNKRNQETKYVEKEYVEQTEYVENEHVEEIKKLNDVATVQEENKCIYWDAQEEKDLLTVANVKNVCNGLFTTNEGEDLKILAYKRGKGEVNIENNVLGQGAFGTVYSGKMATGQDEIERTTVAVKTLCFAKYKAKCQTSPDWALKLQDMIEREVGAMIQCIGHPHIVQLKFATFTSIEMSYGLELVSNGDMFHYMCKHGRVPEDRARIWFHDLSCAILFCHSKGIVHLDIKAENILIDERDNVKLSDFGLAMIAKDPSDPEEYKLLGSCRGTLDYLAPEMARARVCDTRKCDVWSLAIVLFMMVAGFHPCRKPGDLPRIWRGIIEFPPGFPPGPMSVIQRALIVDSQQRASMKDLVEHEWVKGEPVA